MLYFNKLQKKIKTKKAVVGIIGIGYVGSALALVTSNSGFETYGFDIDRKKIDDINSLKKSRLFATTDILKLNQCDIICICVPTPIQDNKKPDLNPLISAVKQIARALKKEQLIIIESTINVGTTRNIVLPFLKKSGLTPDEDFFLCYSPERIDPGNKKYSITNTAKIVSGLNNKSLRLATLFYLSFIEKVVAVSSLEAAEMTKLLENTFRFVNISLVNELSHYMHARNLSIAEIISAAATKPFGFLPHYPGPGIGGHCIAVDPYYLLDDAKLYGYNLQIVKTAGLVNDKRPNNVAYKALEILQNRNNLSKHYRVLLIGIAYKPNVADYRESAALKIWKRLRQKGITVFYHDPYIAEINGKSSLTLTKQVLKQMDLIIITTNHDTINYKKILSCQKPILDTRNVFNGNKSDDIYRV